MDHRPYFLPYGRLEGEPVQGLGS
jgi:hypothetical protein